jgi:hypothetical protein
MGGTIVSHLRVTLAAPHGLLAAEWREHWDAPAKRRGPIDPSRRAIEGIRHDRVHPALGLLGLAGRQ